jgi:hypothetical protein
MARTHQNALPWCTFLPPSHTSHLVLPIRCLGGFDSSLSDVIDLRRTGAHGSSRDVHNFMGHVRILHDCFLGVTRAVQRVFAPHLVSAGQPMGQVFSGRWPPIA